MESSSCNVFYASNILKAIFFPTRFDFLCCFVFFCLSIQSLFITNSNVRFRNIFSVFPSYFFVSILETGLLRLGTIQCSDFFFNRLQQKIEFFLFHYFILPLILPSLSCFLSCGRLKRDFRFIYQKISCARAITYFFKALHAIAHSYFIPLSLLKISKLTYNKT